ncbi:MAG: thioredoxin-disulfide reductase [Candidatus Levybacteria bacterium RIFCSPHIGHO2_01_FULL_40_15b]|nr:MAG: thioredoxin-disulfide reductase [Candidatus Levybacteria bacterium RIFCSPHIGHO2_01_FULL_40_15b]
MELYDVIIIGSGPAGLTAALYATRANLKTLVVAGRAWGGQLMLTTLVENYPGFPEGIQGPDLMMAMRKQAEHHGAQIIDVDFKSANYGSTPFKIRTDDEKEYSGRTVIIATGAETRWLEVPGEKEKIGRGVSSCAPCDAPFFRNKNAIVVGGGDSAMEEALVLTKFASSVTIVHRRGEFRASQIMQKRVKENPKIKLIFDSEIVEILGENKVEKVKIKNNKTNEISEMPVEGVFVAIGHIPNSALFQGIDRDEQGFIKVYDHTKTNIDGVYVAGDVHDAEYKQAVTAAGFGCMAALEVEKYSMNQN